MIAKFFLLPIVAALITFVSTPLVIALARRLRLVDDSAKRFHPAHTHTGVIPRAGGLAIYLGLSITILALLGISKPLMGILLGATILLITGLFDDKKDVNPYIRIVSNILAALCVVGSGISIPFVTNPLTGGIIHLDTWRISFILFGAHSFLPLANIAAILWIVWTMNIVGWSSGIDGQLPGFVVVASLVLGMLSIRFLGQDPAQISVLQLSLITAGSFLGFLPWNFYPQKIMPGYAGKTLAGFLLATLAILAQAKVGTAVLVLGIPMTDALYTLARRLVKGRSPVWADRGHLHHRLLDLGWGKRRIAVFYWLISALLGGVALSVTARGKFFIGLLLVVWLGGLIIWANIFDSLGKKKRDT